MSDPGPAPTASSTAAAPAADAATAAPAAPKPTTTLYVKGLPTSAQSADLEAFFSEYGPVRQCFVVQDSSDKSKNRGFGFVHFAVPEDALSALQQAKERPFLESGKTLTLELAKPREKLEDRTSKKRKGAPTDSETAGASSAAERADDGAANKKIKTGTEQFTNTPAVASTAPNNVSSSSSSSSSLAKAATVLPDAKKPKITPATTARLIVRNLSFKCTPATLRTTFGAYGTVTECTMPRKFEPSGPYRGFGIVQFAKRAEAQRAIDHMNEKEICGRQVAVDWCIPQAQFLVAEGVDKDEVARRLKDKFEKGKGRLDTDLGIVEQDDDDEDDQSGSDDDSDHVSDDDDANSDGSDDEDTMSVDGDNKPSATRTQRHPMPALDAGTTVFIRNVPFEATEDDLIQCFSTFGPLVYAKITKDKHTGKSKGTAFACYTTKAHADACLEEASKTNDMAYAMTTTASIGSSTGGPAASAPMTSSNSLLTPDLPSTLSTSTLILSGRLLNVTRAVSRDLAATLTAKERLKRERRDKRNTYLLSEGWQGDLADRRAALEGNHALYVSRTRVALRRVPLHVGDVALRAFATAAARGYLERIVKRGKDREWPLPADEIESGVLDPNKVREWPEEVAKIKTVVRQAKVVRAKDRVGTDGQLRSKGFGFVEFADELAALACVRALAKPELARVRKLVLEHLVEKEEEDETKEGESKEGDDKMEVDEEVEDAVERANALAEQDDDEAQQKQDESGSGSNSDSDEDLAAADSTSDAAESSNPSDDEDDDEEDEDVPTHTLAGKPIPEIIVEFAIENRQVVNMRDAKLKRLQKAQQVQRANVTDRQSQGRRGGSNSPGAALGGRGGRGGSGEMRGRGGSRGGSSGGFRGRGGAAGGDARGRGGSRGGSAGFRGANSSSSGAGRGRGGNSRGGGSFGRGGGSSRGGSAGGRGGNAGARGGGRGGRGGRGGGRGGSS
ncbi:hypothetical protein BCR44DRAFT_29750 [Catenaria anguillulae PL171]|uniref:RRM domain-containing protein n=1 Tax=Catenaria anguillulae PL171 TaxID=765915 RepID=A0A1Y2HPL3_9FUNG|nr:hypothetical protein BCR44DRAFT_29750 [Catenaria anguillulae PL171]